MTLRNSLLFLGFGLFGSFAIGCKPTPAVDSSDVATHGMSMEVRAISDGTSTDLSVKLWVGDAANRGTLVTLSKDDSLQLTQPSMQVLGITGEDGQGKIYGATLAALDASTISIDLKRAKAASALGNSVNMPPAFTLTGPTGMSVSRAGTTTIGWNRADGSHSMRLTVRGDCLETLDKTITGDPGTYVFNAGDIKPFCDAKAKDSCSASLTLTRELNNSGTTFSAEFGHASVGYAAQTRTLAFTSSP
jgi:hypothetical protein